MFKIMLKGKPGRAGEGGDSGSQIMGLGVGEAKEEGGLLGDCFMNTLFHRLIR